jgi:hypothetical protein
MLAFGVLTLRVLAARVLQPLIIRGLGLAAALTANRRERKTGSRNHDNRNSLKLTHLANSVLAGPAHARDMPTRQVTGLST